MVELKLAKLPDRALVRITISVSPYLNKKLEAYAEVYREAYGVSEKIGELIPFMLERFITSDRRFTKSRKEPS